MEIHFFELSLPPSSLSLPLLLSPFCILFPSSFLYPSFPLYLLSPVVDCCTIVMYNLFYIEYVTIYITNAYAHIYVVVVEIECRILSMLRESSTTELYTHFYFLFGAI